MGGSLTNDISGTITTPSAPPEPSDFYYVIISVYDLSDSYDQIGYVASGNGWYYVQSYTTACNPNNNQYVVTVGPELALNTQYTFDMYANNGVITFTAYYANTSAVFYSSQATTGGSQFLENNIFACWQNYNYYQFDDYTDYEELLTTQNQPIPSWNFLFYGNSMGSYWTPYYVGTIPSVNVGTHNGDVYVENQPLTAQLSPEETPGHGDLAAIMAAGSTISLSGQWVNIGSSCSSNVTISVFSIPVGERSLVSNVNNCAYSMAFTVSCDAVVQVQPDSMAVSMEILDTTTGYYTLAGFKVGVAAVQPGTCPTTIPAGTDPTNMTYDSFNNYLYVLDSAGSNGGSAVSVVDTLTRSFVTNISLSYSALPRQVIYDPASLEVYVIDYGGYIDFINGTSIVSTYHAPFAPFAAAYNWFDGIMFVTDFSMGSAYGVVDEINSSNGVTTINLPNNGHGAPINGATLITYGPGYSMFVYATPTAGGSYLCFITISNSVGCVPANDNAMTFLSYDVATDILYYNDLANDYVYCVTPNLGTWTTVGYAGDPEAATADPYGYIWVADTSGSQVMEFYHSGVGCAGSGWSLVNSYTENGDPVDVAWVPASSATSAYNPAGSFAAISLDNSNNVIGYDWYGSVGDWGVGSSPSALAYDPVMQVVYDADSAGNTVTLSPNANPYHIYTPPPTPGWSSQGSQSPGQRYASAMTFVNASNQEYLLFGGMPSTGQALGDTWSMAGGTWQSICSQAGPCGSPPPPLWGASMVYGDSWVMLFGGCLTGSPCTAVSGSTYLFDYVTNTWSLLSFGSSCPLTPPARYFAAMAAVPGQNVAILYGGLGPTGTVLGDTWEFTYRTGSGYCWGQPTVPGQTPQPLASPAMTYNLADPNHPNEMVLFGGMNQAGQAQSGTYLFVGFAAGSATSGSWILWNPATVPPPRWGASSSWYGNGNLPAGTGMYVLMFGGTSGTSMLSDTWVFTGMNWVQESPTTVPNGVAYAMMGFSYSAGSIFLYGGCDPIPTPPLVSSQAYYWS
jgi:hypothetical protein